MTTAILRTTKILLRWSEKPFTGKSAAPNRIILRHGAAGRIDWPTVPNTNGTMDSTVGDATLPLQRCVDRHKNERIGNQPTLAFGVRLIC